MENYENYIIGNTEPVTLLDLQKNHIIPTHAKDNSTLLSQFDFIETTEDILQGKFESISAPSIRVSHKIRGRIPEARFKSKDELLPNEETIYFDRMIFLFGIKNITKMVNGNSLNLVVGGVKCYSQDNLNGDYKTLQKFKVFMGFQVKVCSNLCIWTDGSMIDIKCNSLDALQFYISEMVENYNYDYILSNLDKLDNYSIREKQIALILGRMRMFNFMPIEKKYNLVDINIKDTQVSQVIKQYYTDKVFGIKDRELNLWEFYNLLTQSTKSSYIGDFTDRNIASSILINELIDHLDGKKESFFLT